MTSSKENPMIISLADYFQKVVKLDLENDDEPVKIQEIDS